VLNLRGFFILFYFILRRTPSCLKSFEWGKQKFIRLERRPCHQNDQSQEVSPTKIAAEFPVGLLIHVLFKGSDGSDFYFLFAAFANRRMNVGHRQGGGHLGEQKNND